MPFPVKDMLKPRYEPRVGKQRLSNAEKASLGRHGLKCHYCGHIGALTFDHVLPRSKGGDNSAENLVPCCYSCNSAKGSKTYDVFVEDRLADLAGFYAFFCNQECI